MRERSDALKAELQEGEGECGQIENDFIIIQKQVAAMVSLFQRSKFYLSVASGMTYDEKTFFNENNIV